jgi:hypothetical protein
MKVNFGFHLITERAELGNYFYEEITANETRKWSVPQTFDLQKLTQDEAAE